MALSLCPDDILLYIASHIYRTEERTEPSVDFMFRREIFKNLVLVSRRFNAVFTRLLYRTLCLEHANYSGPLMYKERWLDQNPCRRLTAFLLRSLNDAPSLGHYTHCLEVSWELYDDRLGNFSKPASCSC